jgi:hypothetical protein
VIRKVCYLTLLIIGLSGSAIYAQGSPLDRSLSQLQAELKSWTQNAKDNRTTYIAPDEFGSIIIYEYTGSLAADENAQFLNNIYMLGSSLCPGFGNSPPQEKDGWKVFAHTAGDARCNFFVTPANNNKGVIGFSFEKVSEGQYLYRYALAAAYERIGNSNSGATGSAPVTKMDTTSPKQQNAQLPQTANGSSDLKAAIDRIAANRRPIGLVYTEGEWDSYNASVTFDPHLLFPGGIAISPDCKSWDPAKPITATSAMGCGYIKYTLSGRTAYIKGESSNLDDYQGFKKGERVSINFSTVGATPMNISNPGSGAVWGGDLFMSPQGSISVGSWSGATVNGDNVFGFSGSEKQGIQGEYYLDGYIIGVKDSEGRISVDFIWQQDGEHVFLNGEQYNR